LKSFTLYDVPVEKCKDRIEAVTAGIFDDIATCTHPEHPFNRFCLCKN
jgi:hypothetical protein